MKQIPLWNREGDVVAYAMVDDDDYDWLMRWRWRLGSGYAVRGERRGGIYRTIRMHVLLCLTDDDYEVDHRDRNRLNNQRDNLRPATRALNTANRGVFANNALGLRGVRRQAGGRYQARARSRSLGTFDTPEEAAAAVATYWETHEAA